MALDDDRGKPEVCPSFFTAQDFESEDEELRECSRTKSISQLRRREPMDPEQVEAGHADESEMVRVEGEDSVELYRSPGAKAACSPYSRFGLIR